MMDKAKLKKRAFIASLAALVVVGSTAAFLTGKDLAGNWFKVAKVDLDITESFDQDRTLSAGEIITKQPSVKNTGDVDQLFFVEICVPVMNTTLVDSEGQRIIPSGATPTDAEGYRQEAEIYDLLANKDGALTVEHSPADSKYGEFSYQNAEEGVKGWYFLGEGGQFTVSETNRVPGFTDGKYNTYLFGYNAMTAPGETTIPVFDKLRLRSMVDGDIPGGTVGQVTVRAYTIQANELNIEGLTGDGSETSLYTEADLVKIYKILENKSLTGQGG